MTRNFTVKNQQEVKDRLDLDCTPITIETERLDTGVHRVMTEPSHGFSGFTVSEETLDSLLEDDLIKEE